MMLLGWLQLGVYFLVLGLLVKPLGAYMARVYQGERTLLTRLLEPVECLIYRLIGVQANDEMDWKTYAIAMLLFNFAGLVLLYLLLRTQNFLPINPQNLGAVNPHLAFNTTVSFVTNTNWQSYSGETTLSYLTQMLGMTVQNFISAATGMAVLIALTRGILRHTARTIGSFWVDLTRGVLYILLPFALVLSLLLVSQGVVQTFTQSQTVTLLQPMTDRAPANPGCWSGRFTGCHQAIGNQWRRILQCQFCASIREPYPAN
jgi:K+-transporting ATPase ATPase A chain